MTDFRERLEEFLLSRNETINIQQLTPDASTREYFRVHLKTGSAIACMYPEPFVASDQSYIDVTNLFLKCGLPVAKILDFDEKLGAILLEDLGDNILRDALNEAAGDARNRLVNRAIELIPRIQAATGTAYATNSIASRLRFDVEKLSWELDFFKTHYFTTLRAKPLSRSEDSAIAKEFLEMSKDLENKASVLCHRDFHAANLMIDHRGELRIIDHQDARIGSPTYDLVSLLLDRVTDLPTSDWLAAKRRFFLDARESLGLPEIDEAGFANEFRMQTIQRCLKAAGTFSFQSATRDKIYFIPFIQPMLQIALRAAENLGRFPVLRSVITREIEIA